MKKNYLLLHFVILLWGFTPVLGKLISLGAYDLVWYRLVFSLITLFIYMKVKGIPLKADRAELLRMVGAGLTVGVHWFFFYHAIKVSNVAVTLAGFSTVTLFGSLLQPLLLRKKFFAGDLIYGVVIAVGLIVILNFERIYFWGIFYGVIAAITGAFFSVYNGRLIQKSDAAVITFFEFAAALALISVMKVFDQSSAFIAPLDVSNWIYLLLLSVLCTTLAFTISVELLKQFSPLTVIITNNLEPIYGIVFSVILFRESEYMSTGFYIGTAIILVSVFTYPLISARYKERSELHQ